MLKFINENDYMNLLDCDSIPNNFNSLVIQASELLNSMTYNRICDVNERIKYVTCLFVDVLNEQKIKMNEVSNLKSENVEGWSKTYVTSEELTNSYNNRLYEIARQYLTLELGKDGKPLMYCGVI